MKKWILVLSLVCLPKLCHAAALELATTYYTLQHDKVVKSTATASEPINTYWYRGDFKVVNDTYTVNVDDITPYLILYGTGTIWARRIETTEFVTISSQTSFNTLSGSSITVTQIKANNGNGLKLYEDGGAGIVVADGGNVGIGTTNPLAKLEVASGANTNILIGKNTTNGNYNGISLNGSLAENGIIGMFAGGTGDSSLYFNANGTYYFRKSDNTLLATINQSGDLYLLRGIVGTTTNDDATAGNYGEYKSTASLNTPIPTSGQWGDIVSFSLTAGDWLVTWQLSGFNVGGATYTGQWYYGIGQYAGNNGTGMTLGVHSLTMDNVVQNFTGGGSVSVRVSLAGTTTIYAKIYHSGYADAVPTVQGCMFAVRIR